MGHVRRLALVFSTFFLAEFQSIPRVGADSRCLSFGTFSQNAASLQNISDNFSRAMTDAGLCVDVLKLPLQRSHSMLLSGELDGQVARVLQYEDAVKSVAIRIPSPVASGVGRIITFKEDWGEVRSVGLLRGSRWQVVAFEDYRAKNAQIPLETLVTSNPSSLIRMFVAERVDAILVAPPEYKDVLKQSAGMPIHSLQIADLAAYTFIHKSKAQYADAIEQAILAYQAKGYDFTAPLTQAAPEACEISEATCAASDTAKTN